MGRLVRACVCKHLYIRVVQGRFFLELHPYDCNLRWNSFSQSKVSYQLQLCNCQLTLCVHPSKCASLSLCVRVCVCEMCLHASVHNIMCSAQPEVYSSCFRLVRSWSRSSILANGEGGSDRTPGSVRSTQSKHRRKILGASPRILDPLILITSVYNNKLLYLLCRLPLPGHRYILSPFDPYIAFMHVQFMCISIIHNCI